MAKRRKSAKSASVKGDDDIPLVGGKQSPCVMGSPNHRVKAVATWRDPFPLLSIMGDENVPLFRLPDYGLPFHDYQESEGPPSWMDPIYFARLCKDNPEVQAVLAEAMGKDRLAVGIKKLQPLLVKIFDEQYLPTLIGLFDMAKPYLAEWLTINHAAIICGHESDEHYLKEQAKNRRRKRIGLIESGDVEDEISTLA